MKKKFSDESGWVRVVVCFAALLIHHGLRDALITALPTLATTTNSTTVTPTPKSIHITPSTQVNSNLTTTSRTIHMTPSTQATSTTFTPTPKSIHMTPSTQATSTTLTTTPRSIHMTPSTQANQVTTKENVENVENEWSVALFTCSSVGLIRGGGCPQEEWSVVVEGVVLSSVFWGWLVAALLADLIIDRGGAARVLCVSVGVTGLAGLVTHAASLGGPWAMLGLRVVQGTVQGVSYPAVVRVLEGVPTAARAPAALLVFMGPPLGTGLGAGLGSLREWYLATYLVGSLGLVLAPLCLMLPPPPDATPHKEMHLSRVLRCRGVWACVGVHAATTWALHTLLVGVSFCLAHTHLDNPAAPSLQSGWVVAAVAVVACGAARGMLFFAAKYSGKGPSTALNRRRVPVVAGTVMVTAAVIAMATAGLNAVEVLVGVGVGLAGLGVGVARAGYRLNVDDMAPRGAWRVTRVLDITAVVTAAMCPVVVAALAQAGGGGWVGVWLVPLAALLPAAAVHCFLLTSNPQPWDHTDKTTAANTNGAAGGVAPTLSVGRRQSFKSARSALTFKSANDELEGDMYSVASISVECRSVEDEPDQECVSVASSSTFKSDGADMHSVVDETNATNNAAATKQGGRQFGSMLVNGATTDRTSAWLSSHHDLDLETAGHPAVSASPSRADTHATNAIYGLLW
ncbi:Sialin [Chionoecetes opilio]|uniref:Sialin n=1 Tax=Chionoecetes opilio TaxID=41210 RepID=A0A8J4XUM7_CHIOP|nr:Sialin [Chionoecetes opilio]